MQQKPNLSFSTPRELRRAIRAGTFTGQTAGQCRGYTQGNLAVLPAAYAGDFRRFCELNPKPCPIIGVSEPGSARVPKLGVDLDIRTDISDVLPVGERRVRARCG